MVTLVWSTGRYNLRTTFSADSPHSGPHPLRYKSSFFSSFRSAGCFHHPLHFPVLLYVSQLNCILVIFVYPHHLLFILRPLSLPHFLFLPLPTSSSSSLLLFWFGLVWLFVFWLLVLFCCCCFGGVGSFSIVIFPSLVTLAHTPGFA